jgi:hypothetical protein
MTRSQEVAQVILSQIGGKRFQMMTGAKNFIAGQNENKEHYLSFKIPRSNKITHITISLTVMDEYNMKFISVHGTKIKDVAEVKGLFFDQLQEVFTEYTGLLTRM